MHASTAPPRSLGTRPRLLRPQSRASCLRRCASPLNWPRLSACLRPPGSTYRDDGLHAKMEPLIQTASELTTDLAYMGKVGGVKDG